MAYTPELSQANSCTLRRVAWALDQPMTKAMALVFDYLGRFLDAEKVCYKCRDKTRCNECAFYRKRI